MLAEVIPPPEKQIVTQKQSNQRVNEATAIIENLNWAEKTGVEEVYNDDHHNLVDVVSSHRDRLSEQQDFRPQEVLQNPMTPDALS